MLGTSYLTTPRAGQECRGVLEGTMQSAQESPDIFVANALPKCGGEHTILIEKGDVHVKHKAYTLTAWNNCPATYSMREVTSWLLNALCTSLVQGRSANR
jgi:hypothetical protein